MSSSSASDGAPGARASARTPSSTRSALARLTGFILLPAFGALAPLLALPAITARFGEHGWAAVAIGQSLGSAFAVVVELGWRLNGTQRVARQQPINRTRTLALATTTKVAVLIPVGIVVGVAAAVISPGHKGISAVVAVAGVVGSLDLVWFFIGTGRPMMILLTDALPRDLPVVAAALAIALGSPLWAFPLALTVGALAAPAVGMWTAGVRRASFRGITAARTIRTIRIQSSAFTGTALSAIYIALPVTLVGVVNPAAVSVFAAADRMQRMLLSGLQAVPNSMQGWVGGATSKKARLRRAWRALFVNAGVGFVAGGALLLLAPLISSILFSGVAPVTSSLAAVSAVIVVVVCCSRATGSLILVALKGIPSIRTSALVGCLVGIPAILILGRLLGPIGGLVGEASAELSVLAVQLSAIARLTARERLRDVGHTTRVVYFGVLPGVSGRANQAGLDLDLDLGATIVRCLDPDVESVSTTTVPQTGTGIRITRLLRDVLRIVVDSHGHDVYVLPRQASVLAPAAWTVARMNGALLVLDRSEEQTAPSPDASPHASPHPDRARRWLRDRLAARLADAVYVSPAEPILHRRSLRPLRRRALPRPD